MKNVGIALLIIGIVVGGLGGYLGSSLAGQPRTTPSLAPSEIGKIQEQLAELSSELRESEEELLEAQSFITVLQSNLTHARSEAGVLASELNRTSLESSESILNIEAISDQRNLAEERAQELSTDVESLQSGLSDAMSEVSRLETELASRMKMLSQIELDVEDLEQRILDLELSSQGTQRVLAKVPFTLEFKYQEGERWIYNVTEREEANDAVTISEGMMTISVTQVNNDRISLTKMIFLTNQETQKETEEQESSVIDVKGVVVTTNEELDVLSGTGSIQKYPTSPVLMGESFTFPVSTTISRSLGSGRSVTLRTTGEIVGTIVRVETLETQAGRFDTLMLEYDFDLIVESTLKRSGSPDITAVTSYEATDQIWVDIESSVPVKMVRSASIIFTQLGQTLRISFFSTSDLFDRSI